jgi:hypothetical protein
MLPEEQELERLEVEQARLKDQVASAELTLNTVKTETATFRHRYYRTVGRLYAELDALDAELSRLRMQRDPDNPAVREQARAAEHRARKSAGEAGLLEVDPKAPPKIEPGLKEAYRRAVKLLHPDLATTEHERLKRTELMALLNDAYERGDQRTIDRVIEDYREDPDSITGDDIATRIVKAIRRNAQLRRRLTELEQEMEAEKKTEIFELKQRVEIAETIGGDPLGDLAKQLLQQTAERKVRLKAAEGLRC